jgi:hypothetical protein
MLASAWINKAGMIHVISVLETWNSKREAYVYEVRRYYTEREDRVIAIDTCDTYAEAAVIWGDLIAALEGSGYWTEMV